MLHRFALMIFGLTLLTLSNAATAEQNTTVTNRVEIIITVAGMQESVASIKETSKQITELTQHLSKRGDFTSQDREVISALTDALNNNANSINNIASAIPQQFETAQGGIKNILENVKVNAQEVVTSSKNDLIDPTLSRIENRVLLLLLAIALILFGLLWYGLWKLRSIVSTGGKTVENIMNTVKSLEKVVEKASKNDK